MKASMGGRSTSAAGQRPVNYSDEEPLPVGIVRPTDKGSQGSIGSLGVKGPNSGHASKANEEELETLRQLVEDRDRQLREQASSLAEMETSLNEVQSLMASDTEGGASRSSMEDKDVSQLRMLLREKNEKIAILTVEFDAHRADFRSTIDTLEMASTETERVYEKKVEDLLQDIRELQERSEDVESVAQQLKQLEELVQELEEGLEDARRGEAEARGEVEFLRGEVERGRSELKREREKAAAAVNDALPSTSGDSVALTKELEQRDDEIRGLKAIIHSLSRDAVPDVSSPDGEQKTPTQRNSRQRSSQSRGGEHHGDPAGREQLEKEVGELRSLIVKKSSREEELERELEALRQDSQSGATQGHRASAASNGTVKQDRSTAARDSKGSVVSWKDRELPRTPEVHRRGNTLESMPESDTYSSATDASALWCGICDNAGHDILTCPDMFAEQAQSQATPNGTGNGAQSQKSSPSQARTGKDAVREGAQSMSSSPHGEYKPAPLSPKKVDSVPTPIKIMPNPMIDGPVAGKESGTVDPDKWCGVCERDGHDSIDCPFEDAF